MTAPKTSFIALALAGALGSAAEAQDKTLTISVYSFAQDEYKEALYDPFEEICGCELVVETGNSVERMAKIEANAADPVIDMAVLSIGMEPSADAQRLAEIFGMELDHYRFAKTSDFTPVTTSRPGVFVAGAFQAPNAIPRSVAEA